MVNQIISRLQEELVLAKKKLDESEDRLLAMRKRAEDTEASLTIAKQQWDEWQQTAGEYYRQRDIATHRAEDAEQRLAKLKGIE